QLLLDGTLLVEATGQGCRGPLGPAAVGPGPAQEGIDGHQRAQGGQAQRTGDGGRAGDRAVGVRHLAGRTGRVLSPALRGSASGRRWLPRGGTWRRRPPWPPAGGPPRPPARAWGGPPRPPSTPAGGPPRPPARGWGGPPRRRGLPSHGRSRPPARRRDGPPGPPPPDRRRRAPRPASGAPLPG